MRTCGKEIERMGGLGTEASDALVGCHPASSLLGIIRSAVESRSADKDARFTAAFVDLKNDGSSEAIVHLSSSSWCGTGGCTLLIMAPDGDSYKLISKIPAVRPSIKMLTTITKGWHGSSYSDNASIPPAHRMRGKSNGKVIIPVNAKNESPLQIVRAVAASEQRSHRGA